MKNLITKEIKSTKERSQQGIKTNYHEGSLRIENKEFNNQNEIGIPANEIKNIENIQALTLLVYPKNFIVQLI